jgi:hypothetical protein
MDPMRAQAKLQANEAQEMLNAGLDVRESRPPWLYTLASHERVYRVHRRRCSDFASDPVREGFFLQLGDQRTALRPAVGGDCRDLSYLHTQNGAEH